MPQRPPLRPEDMDPRLLDRLNAQDSLAEFIRQAWRIVEPVTPLRWARHLDAIAEHLEAVAAGEIRQLLINVMPRSGKSLWTSVFFPVWLWLKHPEERLVFASYSAALAVKLSTDRRTILQSAWFQRNWPKVRLADDSNEKAQYVNTARGSMVATSVGASITGRGGNYIVCDDLLNPEDANSDALREGSLRWFREVLSSRLDDKKRGRLIVIEQRVHQGDLSGTLLAEGGWTHLSLPAQFDERTTITLPRSGKALTFEQGELLWPEREGEKELVAAKLRLGSFAYNSQYLQAPTSRGGNVFRAEWIRRYSSLPARFDRTIMALDTAFKVSTTADYSALTVLGQLTERSGDALPGTYLTDAWRGKVEFPELKRIVTRYAGDHRPSAVVVEDAASGQSLIQELKQGTGLNVLPQKPDRDKLSRASAVTPLFEAGRVFLPSLDQGWLGDFTAELLAFPGGQHDDWVDSLVWGLAYLQRQTAAQVRSYSLGAFLNGVREPLGSRPAGPRGDLELGRTPGKCAENECANCHCWTSPLDLRPLELDDYTARVCVVCWRKLARPKPDFLRA